jgi:hypothetical protein
VSDVTEYVTVDEIIPAVMEPAQMNNKVVIGGIVAAILILGGIGYSVMSQKNSPPPPGQVIPPSQLQNELPASSNLGTNGNSTDGAVHSSE